MEHDGVALGYVDRESTHGDWLYQGGICFDNLDCVVVDRDLEFSKGTGVDESQAISFSLGDVDYCSCGILVASVATIRIIRRAVEAFDVSSEYE